jgi:hypothetical protein
METLIGNGNALPDKVAKVYSSVFLAKQESPLEEYQEIRISVGRTSVYPSIKLTGNQGISVKQIG